MIEHKMIFAGHVRFLQQRGIDRQNEAYSGRIFLAGQNSSPAETFKGHCLNVSTMKSTLVPRLERIVGVGHHRASNSWPSFAMIQKTWAQDMPVFRAYA